MHYSRLRLGMKFPTDKRENILHLYFKIFLRIYIYYVQLIFGLGFSNQKKSSLNENTIMVLRFESLIAQKKKKKSKGARK